MNTEENKTIVRARVVIVLSFFGLLLVCVLNVWAFQTFFNRDYIKWYSNAGPFIALATAAFGAAWGGLDKNPALVSANPLEYLAACLQVASLPLIAFGAHLHSENRREAHVGFEFLPLLVLFPAFVLAIFAWLLLVVPAQYFLFLVVGALSRMALTSSAQISARIKSGQVELVESKDPVPKEPPKAEDGWWDASMRDKPVTLASAFGGALLYLLSLLWR